MISNNAIIELVLLILSIICVDVGIVVAVVHVWHTVGVELHFLIWPKKYIWQQSLFAGDQIMCSCSF